VGLQPRFCRNRNKHFLENRVCKSRSAHIRTSRRMLWEFSQQHKEVSSVYFVSGWDTKKQRHVAALITDTDVPGTFLPNQIPLFYLNPSFPVILVFSFPPSHQQPRFFGFSGVKDRFAPVMSLHVYAVGMELPKDSAHLWQIDHEIRQSKFREAVLAGQDAPTETSAFGCNTSRLF
jgi:hypothetical protein